MNGFHELGFLSDLTEVIRQIREDFSEALGPVYVSSIVAMKLLQGTALPVPSAAIQIALTSLCQCITCCQASVVLCERGMPIPAASTLRTAYEYLFLSSALLKHPDCLQELCNSDDGEKEKQVKEIKKVIRGYGDQADTLFSPSDLEALTNYPKVLAPKKFGAYEMADKGGMLEYYQSIYRELSRQGAHATVSALDYAVAYPVGTLRFAPVEDESTVSVLSHTDTCLKLCIQLVTSMAATSPRDGS